MSVSPSSHKRKVGESNPIQPRCQGDWLATRFLSQFGYLPYSVDRPGIEPGFPPRQGGVVPLDHQPRQWSADPDFTFVLFEPRSHPPGAIVQPVRLPVTWVTSVFPSVPNSRGPSGN